MDNAGSDRTVIVIDDDVATFKGLIRIAKYADFEAATFTDCWKFANWLQGQSSVASASSQSFCLVIDAKSLPPDPEWHLNPRIRSIPKICIGTPAAISTMGQIMDGFDGEFVRKPFTLDSIRMYVEDALTRSASKASEEFENRRMLQMFGLLTKREHEVAALVGSGSANLEIAAALGITLKTVKAHRAKVMGKTGASTIADFVRKFERYKQAVLKLEETSSGRTDRHKKGS